MLAILKAQKYLILLKAGLLNWMQSVKEVIVHTTVEHPKEVLIIMTASSAIATQWHLIFKLIRFLSFKKRDRVLIDFLGTLCRWNAGTMLIFLSDSLFLKDTAASFYLNRLRYRRRIVYDSLELVCLHYCIMLCQVVRYTQILLYL